MVVLVTETVNRIRKLRESREWHRSVIAGEFNIGERTVMRWEKGEAAVPSDVIPRLAAKFEVSPEYLMGWDREEAPAA